MYDYINRFLELIFQKTKLYQYLLLLIESENKKKRFAISQLNNNKIEVQRLNNVIACFLIQQEGKVIIEAKTIELMGDIGKTHHIQTTSIDKDFHFELVPYE